MGTTRDQGPQTFSYTLTHHWLRLRTFERTWGRTRLRRIFESRIATSMETLTSICGRFVTLVRLISCIQRALIRFPRNQNAAFPSAVLLVFRSLRRLLLTRGQPNKSVTLIGAKKPQMIREPCHASEWRWSAFSEIKIKYRHTVMAVVHHQHLRR